MREIPLTRGKTAIVDDEDYEYLSQWKWHFDGHYAARKNREVGKLYMHRLLLGGNKIDHIVNKAA